MSDTDDQKQAARKAEPYQNEPHTDFSRAENRKAFAQALKDVEEQLGREYPIVIDGKAVSSRKSIVSLNPSHKSQTVGTVMAATVDHAEQAVTIARRAFEQWRKVEATHRAEYLELIAAEMRNRRFELAAWMVYECGKPWMEADGDVAEAIDFCTYYAMQMRLLDVPVQCDYPGEENIYFYQPRGVAVVISPWNFPLAILTGMTVAALVTGNTVIMKPAEQSSIVAAKLFEMIRDSGIPDGVVSYLPGYGEEIGPALVENPDVDVIAFTGSREVGLLINKQAADNPPAQTHVKKVIAEMGGKNAIIVDEDADLDEAVQGIIGSAFGFSGQKCSACSRVIVLAPAYDAFLDRLKGATESLQFGPAEQPGTTIGPVIDEDALERINDYIEIGREECTHIVTTDAGELAKHGFYVGPHVFADVEPEGRIAQQEIFGPVVAVMKARTLDDAFEIANSTDYALTGGMYSRSPKNLARARAEMRVGNLYLNRPITGALVQRHPFGGYQMSGIGSKAGGHDYLLQFLIPIAVSENTMRRGFAPASDEESM
ncbi:MAG: L-glutamate gamma-semialdehyde dehydrogenase [Planctomycetaceae bacterium]|nr:L-glutamate gamma-semialdehyde dehydrogenase [Planctomycetaceae bacterium]